MLDKDPKKRIRINDIKKHPFFKEIDWTLLSQRKICAEMNVQTTKVMKLIFASNAASRVFIKARYRLAKTTLTNTKMNSSCTVKALITSWREQRSSESSERISKSNSRNGKEKTT